MNIEVKSIDTNQAKAELSKCPKEVQAYVRSLEKIYEANRETLRKAISQLREQCAPNVTEPLGFFEVADDRYYISEIGGVMLTGWRLTPFGMKHTMTIHKDSVAQYVKSAWYWDNLKTE